MKHAEDTHGSLNWMITWQSLQGGIVIEYREREYEAVKLCDHLKELGRVPLIWHRYE